ncbi:hypothetical protein [Streptomyces sp. NPDC020489]|uniref:hypothetical protein n=1 Tax=Streptomyces sp. NPDC020489 TaxID=3365077 RepID=UPI00379B9DCA
MSPHPDLFDGCRVIPTHDELDMMSASAHAPEAARRDGVPNPRRTVWRACRRPGRARVVQVHPGTPLLFRSRGPKAGLLRHVSPRHAWQGLPVGRTAPARRT